MLTTQTPPNESVFPLSPVPDTEVELPHNQLCVSQTPAQIIRRKKFSQKSLQELADSIATRQLQAILVRPLPMVEGIPRYEIVFGERRYLATQIAKKPAVRAAVWVMTDQEALDAQLAENLERHDLDPFAEAAGYQDLMQTYGLTHKQIAARYDHSVKHVINRLLLLQLATPVQEAFDKGDIGIESANLIARVPVHELQLEALEIARRKDATGESMSPGWLRRHIQENFMLELKAAPFDTADETLVPQAGPCGTCLKRTGNQTVLFSDIQERDFCTHPSCFQQKREATLERKRDQARSRNQTIIEGAEAKKIAPYGDRGALTRGYVALDSKCYKHPDHKTYREILGRNAPRPALLEMPQSKELIEVLREEDIAPILAKKGVTVAASSAHPQSLPPSEEEQQRRRRLEIERQFRAQLFETIRAKHPTTLSVKHMRILASRVFSLLPHDNQRRLLGLLKWESAKRSADTHLNRIVEHQLASLEPSGLLHFMLSAVLAPEVYVSGYSDEHPALMKAFAADYGINPRTVRAACVKAAAAKHKKRPSATPAAKPARTAAKEGKPTKVSSK